MNLSIIPWRWVSAGTALALGLALAWGLRVDHLRAGYKDALAVLAEQAHTVVIRLRDASDNPKVTWDTAPGQIVALGESNKALKGSLEEQTAAVDEWAAEAARRQADAAEWRAIAQRAEAQRRSALKRLGDMAATPGTRDDCMVLLREAEDALDLARQAGA